MSSSSPRSQGAYDAFRGIGGSAHVGGGAGGGPSTSCDMLRLLRRLLDSELTLRCWFDVETLGDMAGGLNVGLIDRLSKSWESTEVTVRTDSAIEYRGKMSDTGEPRLVRFWCLADIAWPRTGDRLRV